MHRLHTHGLTLATMFHFRVLHFAYMLHTCAICASMRYARTQVTLVVKLNMFVHAFNV